jgi:hypothetical protein
VSVNGRVWGVNAANMVWTRNGVSGSWFAIDGAFKKITVGIDGRVWAINEADQIWTHPGINGAWRIINGVEYKSFD